jgi:hypothetical protein
MPSRLRHRGLTRPLLARTVRPLPIAILDLMPAIEQACRHHVERLEVLMDQAKNFLEIGQNAPSELVHQECTVRVEYRVGLPENGLPQCRWHGGVRYAREHIVRMMESLVGQRRVGVGSRPMNDMQPAILEPPLKKPYEVGIGLQYNEDGIRSHAPENLGGERTYTWPVLEEHPAPIPVNFRQDVVDQEA